MGRHRAPRMRTKVLRSAYPRLLDAYHQLLDEHRRLEAEQASSPSYEVELVRPPSSPAPAVWGREPEAMDVETACELVRDAGLLIAPGLDA